MRDPKMFLLFPTPLFATTVPDIALCGRVERTILELRRDGHGRSKHTWMSSDEIHRLSDLAELVTLVMDESEKVLDAFAVEREGHYISNMWANITHANHRQQLHVHPNCLLSGLVYIRAPENCSATMFVSPRALGKGLEPRYSKRNEINADSFLAPAQKGKMLFWPSYVPHAAEPGQHDNVRGERIVVAFNVMIRAHISLFTAKLAL
jgi:uncharacterized protein (TIGR02466 family)